MRSKRGNAMNIYYEVHGNGYPIILLHGNQENRKIYDQLVTYKCIYYISKYLLVQIIFDKDCLDQTRKSIQLLF